MSRMWQKNGYRSLELLQGDYGVRRSIEGLLQVGLKNLSMWIEGCKVEDGMKVSVRVKS